MKIVGISPREGFELFLRYDDGVAGVVDLSLLAGRGVFAAWLEPGIFEQVRLTEAGAPDFHALYAGQKGRIGLKQPTVHRTFPPCPKCESP